MNNYAVYTQTERGLEYLQRVTAPTALDALRIAKQKGIRAPIIGDKHD